MQSIMSSAERGRPGVGGDEGGDLAVLRRDAEDRLAGVVAFVEAVQCELEARAVVRADDVGDRLGGLGAPLAEVVCEGAFQSREMSQEGAEGAPTEDRHDGDGEAGGAAVGDEGVDDGGAAERDQNGPGGGTHRGIPPKQYRVVWSFM